MINRIADIKSYGKVLSNCYSANYNNPKSMWDFGNSIAFTTDDHVINRLYYYASNYYELKELIKKAPNGKCYIEIMTKEGDESIDVFKNLISVARLKRVSNRNCESDFLNEHVMHYEDDSIGQLANENDVCEINKIMWSKFRIEVSHLMNDNELKQAIQDREITVHRNEKGNIDAVLVVKIKPRNFYTNHAINLGEKRILVLC